MLTRREAKEAPCPYGYVARVYNAIGEEVELPVPLCRAEKCPKWTDVWETGEGSYMCPTDMQGHEVEACQAQAGVENCRDCPEVYGRCR